MHDIHGNIIEEKTWLTLQSETSASGLTRIIRQDYDKQNRLICVTDNLGAEIKYTYNSIGKRTSEERKINATETQRIAYRYDKAGRLIDRAEELNKNARAIGGRIPTIPTMQMATSRRSSCPVAVKSSAAMIQQTGWWQNVSSTMRRDRRIPRASPTIKPAISCALPMTADGRSHSPTTC